MQPTACPELVEGAQAVVSLRKRQSPEGAKETIFYKKLKRHPSQPVRETASRIPRPDARIGCNTHRI